MSRFFQNKSPSNSTNVLHHFRAVLYTKARALPNKPNKRWLVLPWAPTWKGTLDITRVFTEYYFSAIKLQWKLEKRIFTAALFLYWRGMERSLFVIMSSFKETFVVPVTAIEKEHWKSQLMFWDPFKTGRRRERKTWFLENNIAMRVFWKRFRSCALSSVENYFIWQSAFFYHIKTRLSLVLGYHSAF